ncbi:MAG TPA: hypothetical protein VGR21_09335 [Cryptosporangiaceae bacterium]|nr:hypothetical protein [Cryptosporangiaceae bacterium]
MHEPPTAAEVSPEARRGRLRVPAGSTGGGGLPAGRSTVEVDGRPVGLLYVPPTTAERIVVLLHGAGGSAEQGLRLLIRDADTRRLVLFAPQSAGRTWDMIGDGYGPDVARIQHGLAKILAGYPMPERCSPSAGSPTGPRTPSRWG